MSWLDDLIKGVREFLGQDGPEGPLHHVGADGHADETGGSSANSGASTSGTSGSTSSSALHGSYTLAPGAVQAVEAAIDARLPHSQLHLAPNAVEEIEKAFDARFDHAIHQDHLTQAQTPGQKAAQELLDAVSHNSHLGEPITPHPSPIDPDLGDPNRPPHPTPIGPGGESAGAVGHGGLPGFPSVLTHLANGLPAAPDGTSNTISVGELTGALNPQHPIGNLPPPNHGGGVIDPPAPHLGDLHVADHSADLSAVHLDHAPVSPAQTVHFDALHH